MDLFLDSNSGFVLIGQAVGAPATGGGDALTQQPGTQPLGSDGQPVQPASPFGGTFLFLMLGMVVLMIFMSTMSGRKQKKQRAELLSSLGKHDKVQTVGGVIGTIVEMKDSEIVLKVDEATNTKIRFARSSVQTVIKPAGQRTESSAVQEPEMVASA
ncbi:MAG: preprotein translocase subunit YajC [Planctomycetota bacterium]|jgi:preprotein translocase subunit YajC